MRQSARGKTEKRGRKMLRERETERLREREE